MRNFFKVITKKKMNILGKLKRNTQTSKCLMSVYELVPVLVYKTTEFGMRMVDLDKSTEREEKLIKSFVLPLKNFEVGKVFNYKFRSIEPDNYVRDVKFSVTVTDEVNEFFTSGNLAPELIIFKNAKLQYTDFNFIIKSDSDGYETYTWYQGEQIIVKLKIEKI